MQETKLIFTKEQSKPLKGLFAIVVLLHHTYQKMDICQNLPFVDYFMRSLGYLGVGVFLFISGYGLFRSLEKMSDVNANGGGIKCCHTEFCRYFSLTSS